MKQSDKTPWILIATGVGCEMGVLATVTEYPNGAWAGAMLGAILVVIGIAIDERRKIQE